MMLRPSTSLTGKHWTAIPQFFSMFFGMWSNCGESPSPLVAHMGNQWGSVQGFWITWGRKIHHACDGGCHRNGCEGGGLLDERGWAKTPPYLTSVHWHRCLLSMPGRPPICFRCEQVGHLRHQCNGGSLPQSRPRSYATAVEKPTAGKRMEGPIGKAPPQ